MWRARDRWLTILKHAQQGMWQERPPVSIHDVQRVLEEPDDDDGNEARKRIGKRTLKVYYTQTDEEVWVRAVSATRVRRP